MPHLIYLNHIFFLLELIEFCSKPKAFRGTKFNLELNLDNYPNFNQINLLYFLNSERAYGCALN